MLQQHDQQERLTAFLESLPNRVDVPDQWERRLAKRGVTDPVYDDRRKFARFLLGGADCRAGLEYRQTLPSLPRERGWHGIYVLDFSRNGLRLLHDQLLFPRERFRVLMPNGTLARIEVVRGIRVQAQCYEIGVRFVAEPQQIDALESV